MVLKGLTFFSIFNKIVNRNNYLTVVNGSVVDLISNKQYFIFMISTRILIS
jgi:hypothetical protein